MTQVSGVDLYRKVPANYNAVKIQINNPTTSIPEGFKPAKDDTGIYNAVSLEVNNPTVNVRKTPTVNSYPLHIYNYPENTDIIPFENAIIPPQHLPKLPVTPMYQTFINNKTLVNAEIEFESAKKNKSESTMPAEKDYVITADDIEDTDDIEEAEIIEETKISDENNNINAENKNINDTEVVPNEIVNFDEKALEPVIAEFFAAEIVEIPEENFMDVKEATNINPTKQPSFNGVSFKANKIEIEPAVELKPEVDVANVINKLSNTDYDIQALQMEEIARVSMEDSEKAIPYIVTEIFAELINIVEKDTSDLTPPSEKQIDLRKKIIINEIVKEQAKADGQDLEKIGLPYQLNESEIKTATTLTNLEQAERNKEYALYTMAILSKVYSDHVEKQTGNIVPLTDLPGVSSLVDTLRYSDNSGVKIAAIDALRYIHRPEYNDEIKSVLTLAAQDKDPYAARNAAITLVALEELEHNAQKNEEQNK